MSLGRLCKTLKYMETFIQRIVDEKAELDERAGKLGDFVKSEKFHSLDSEIQSLMVKQYDVMKRYSVILGKRLELLDA
jgi:hypothetical protein